MKMSMVRMMVPAATCLILAACGGGTAAPPPSTLNDWRTPGGSVAQPAMEYRIGALDKLNVTVFQVSDLTLKDVQVDAVGNLQLPLIGTVMAKGKTTAELTELIRSRLAADYLRNPQVTVVVSEAASQKVTVDGAVTQPGVYQMTGNTSLIQAVAMARGPSRTAELTRVAVFRNVDGQRMVAMFDLRAIRRGQAEDPQILGDDVVVVDSSAMSTTIRDVLGALPALAIFRPF
jgi:polysaccharide export outer membrane protein